MNTRNEYSKYQSEFLKNRLNEFEKQISKVKSYNAALELKNKFLENFQEDCESKIIKKFSVDLVDEVINKYFNESDKQRNLN